MSSHPSLGADTPRRPARAFLIIEAELCAQVGEQWFLVPTPRRGVRIAATAEDDVLTQWWMSSEVATRILQRLRR